MSSVFDANISFIILIIIIIILIITLTHKRIL